MTTPVEFQLIPGTTPFIRSVHPGTVNYQNPTVRTAIQQHTERRWEHKIRLHVFKMEQTIDVQMKTHMFSCFNLDLYVDLKQPRIRYTNVTAADVIACLYCEYDEKTEGLQNSALPDFDKEVDIIGQSINPFQLKQEKLKLFVEDTEQAISNGMYIKKCLGVIEKSNYINKVVLTWRARPLPQWTGVLFWLFFTAAHKKQRLKLLQGNNEQANSVMLQQEVKDMALKISQLKRYTDQQQGTINDVVDKVNDDPSIRSRGDRSIPGMIETSDSPSTTDSSKLSTAQALIASLTSSLAEAERNCYRRRQRQGPGRGRGGDRASTGGRDGRGGKRRERGILEEVNNDVDQRG